MLVIDDEQQTMFVLNRQHFAIRHSRYIADPQNSSH